MILLATATPQRWPRAPVTVSESESATTLRLGVRRTGSLSLSRAGPGRMTVRTVPLSGPNPVPETSESLGLETQNLSPVSIRPRPARAWRPGRSPTGPSRRPRPGPCAQCFNTYHDTHGYWQIHANTRQNVPSAALLRPRGSHPRAPRRPERTPYARRAVENRGSEYQGQLSVHCRVAV